MKLEHNRSHTHAPLVAEGKEKGSLQHRKHEHVLDGRQASRQHDRSVVQSDQGWRHGNCFSGVCWRLACLNMDRARVPANRALGSRCNLRPMEMQG